MTGQTEPQKWLCGP